LFWLIPQPGKQAHQEFMAYTPDDHRKFTELYNVQRLVAPPSTQQPRSASARYSVCIPCYRANRSTNPPRICR
jgi:hypothetical protein